jgi:predicted RNase H-like HicB family nuclease
VTKQAKPFELTIVYEHAEGDNVTAQIPSVPGVVSFGASQEEARERVLDAHGEMLSIEPTDAPAGATTERLHMTLSLGRAKGRELGLER